LSFVVLIILVTKKINNIMWILLNRTSYIILPSSQYTRPLFTKIWELSFCIKFVNNILPNSIYKITLQLLRVK
jgi:hypothetical protein